uniref:Uncharacterized protein n=1 Tax=Tetranychus urticae TaxID=32264 RepID=T1KM30_TETUR
MRRWRSLSSLSNIKGHSDTNHLSVFPDRSKVNWSCLELLLDGILTQSTDFVFPRSHNE